MSAKTGMPALFEELLQDGYLSQADICKTEDGFYAVKRGLLQVGGAYLYAVPSREGYAYGLFTMSTQDAFEPGVCVSFAQLDEKLQLSAAVNKTLKAYFRRPQAQGAYLIARLYVEHILAAAQSRHIGLPRYFEELYRQGRGRRLSRFVEINNEDAVHTVCDQETVYIRDLDNVSGFEKLAILATHTGCTSFHSFAAGVRYYARPFGKENAAKLTISEETAPYHSADSKWIKDQKKYHKDI